jgi:hypothetical protein
MIFLRVAAIMLFSLSAAAASAGCGGAIDEKPVSSQARFVVSMWVQDHPDLPLRAVLDGCANWRPEGVACAVTTDRAAAQVQVVVNEDACGTDDAEGIQRIAWAGHNGVVHLRGACVTHDDAGHIDEQDVAAVIGHEVGHELGIWDHVPETCTEDHPVDAEGGDICGAALMNPYYDPTVHFLTAMDGLAFKHRDERRTVAPAVPQGSAPALRPDCTLKRR